MFCGYEFAFIGPYVQWSTYRNQSKMSVTYQIRLDEETKRESFDAFREL